MSNNEAAKHIQSISERIITKEFEETTVPILKKRLYNADAVDHFLTAISSEVERLEKSAKRLLDYYEQNKNGRVAETHSGPIGQNSQPNEVEMMIVQKSKEQRMDRMQLHITELFEEAETKAESIISSAELEKNKIINEGKLEAERIISEAQKKAEEISRVTEEKINEAKLVKNEIDQTSQELREEILGKAQELESMQLSFLDMSQKLRGLT